MSTKVLKNGKAVSRVSEDGSVVQILGFEGDDVALLEALKRGHPNAKRVLFERYTAHVQRILVRIIGIDTAIPELLNETFLQAFSGLRSVRDGGSLKAWLSMIAVFTARGLIRKRKKGRLFWLLEPHKLQDARSCSDDKEGREALDILYEILLDDMPVDEKIVFTLRFVDGMVLREIADACNISMATVKRRLARSEAQFVPMARQHPVLNEWIQRGERWRAK